MSTIILLLSLLLHVVAFYFIVVLFMKYSTIKNLSDTQRQILEETENSMTSFLIDIKDENEKLIRSLLQTSTSTSQKEKSVEIPIENHQKPRTVEIESKKIVNDDTKYEQELPDHLSKFNEVEDIVEIKQKEHTKKPPFDIEVIDLYKEGYTVDQIAKKLKKGKTEIELLLKFRQL